MKFSSGTEFHFAFPKPPDWLSSIGFLLIAAGLVVSLFGAAAERREWQAKHPADKR
jgi:hypothetical protein